jgi:hypothetical protein
MNDRIEQATMAQGAQGAAVPAIGAFLGAEETRLRDLLAYGMAVEAGKPAGAEAVAALQRKAEADLQAHAFRVLHNQVEAIRREAMDEQRARSPSGPSLGQAVLANLIALAIAGFAGFIALRAAAPGLFERLAQTGTGG